MSNYQTSESNIRSIARALLFSGAQIVLCNAKGEDWFFLPGGHVESGESVKTALLRELHEEIGDEDYKITAFVGVCENVFALENDILQHEINIVFKVEIPPGVKINTQEGHIEFICIDKENLKDYKILPLALKDGILEWLGKKEPFFKGI